MRIEAVLAAVAALAVATVALAQDGVTTDQVATADAPVAQAPITDPQWARMIPSCRGNMRFWPQRARRMEIEGIVELDCLVGEGGSLSCSVADEQPPGFGFGESAMRISRCFRMQEHARDGTPTPGRTYRLRVPFRLAD